MRSENDTWDITTSVGSTALFVATARALEAQKHDPLSVDPFAEVFCRAVGGPAADVLDGKAFEHPLKTTDFGEHFVNFQGARTKYFDEYFGRAADAGVRQIAILAAGLDSRAYRLPWPDGTTIFELDQPQVLEFKREVLAEHGAKPKAERRDVAVDLREDWPQALRDSGFDPAKPSAWIVEGLLIYLPATAQQQLFSGVDALAAAGSHIAVEDGAPLPAQEYAAKVEEEREAVARGEQRLFFQLIYNEHFALADRWLSEHGWIPEATPLADYLRELGRPVPGPENTAAGPMVSRNTLVSAVKD
ncbi:class I SAM-dependent methyltransferase [Mycobacterium noviomagense]|uniref:S-adenosyl-L-methionine-dependent methyltransferase n=1 Tax=Mycobacterium noviomagense TaxID=459858 RepID=A0A7I7PDR8_9MYCO|nr:class I SAM-dependent methyltransferase [Mycobacterium noviomagense]ORB12448.1 SAM-dependent methyltransferase [Mycobacterium noviomagense]BBY06711.1 putative S-adenosyl-L-methionine-dependent methyltransferase [Mycobacterium noviomagense]